MYQTNVESPKYVTVENGLDFSNEAKRDEVLKARVTSLLHDLFHDEVSVRVLNAEVTLKGIVRDNITHDFLVGAVREIPYVRGLIDDLKIEAMPAE